MPAYLAIGVPYDLFMDSCPFDLEPFVSANKLEIKMQNSMMHINGLYVRDAIMSSIGNSQWFKGKGQPQYKYPEKPYDVLGEESDEKLTEEQKQRDLEMFIAQEQIRRANWKMKKMRERGELA